MPAETSFPQYAENETQFLYGSPGFQAKLPFANQRTRFNVSAICLCLLAPWLFFTAVFADLSFSFHYLHSGLSWYLVGCGAVIVFICCCLAFQSARQRYVGSLNREPAWYIFLAFTMGLAFCLGIIGGLLNYYLIMEPYYEITYMTTYPSIDPAKVPGQQVMDAGKIMFTPGTSLDLTKSAGYKSGNTYCAVPITSGSDELASYDFWAVGLDCCSSSTSDFYCGDYNNTDARAGLRMTNSDLKTYYEKAVAQAEKSFDLQARNPIFVYWVEDPIDDMNDKQDLGMEIFLCCVLGFFGLQIIVIIMTVVFF